MKQMLIDAEQRSKEKEMAAKQKEAEKNTSDLGSKTKSKTKV